MNIAAGVVCVTEFCTADSSTFSGYINYIDREETVRANNADKYDLFADYQDYMDDEEKTTGLFTKNENNLDENEKSVLKEMFKKAQEKGSMMWQAVFSFDIRWPELVGIYDHETDKLDQERLKAVTRSAAQKLLEKEGLTNDVSPYLLKMEIA